MKRPTIATLRVVARSYGATIDETTEPNEFINVDSPAGKLWSASSTHALLVLWSTVPHEREEYFSRCEAFADCIDRMSAGLVDCDDADCDICEEKRRG